MISTLKKRSKLKKKRRSAKRRKVGTR